LELSAQRRLDEALALYLSERNHTAIYLAGLAAEM
jgi:nicotinamidase-related amidase